MNANIWEAIKDCGSRTAHYFSLTKNSLVHPVMPVTVCNEELYYVKPRVVILSYLLQ